VTNDEVKARLKEMRRHEHEMGPWPDNKTTQALDIALWLLERERAVGVMLKVLASSKYLDRARMQDWERDVIHAACAVEAYEREHPRPEST